METLHFYKLSDFHQSTGLKKSPSTKNKRRFRYHKKYKAHLWEAHGEGAPPKEVPLCFCSVCGTSHKGKTLLRIHMRNAHSQGPSACKICGKVMKNFGSMKNHMSREHSKNQQCKCPVCSEVFPQRYAMLRHYAKVHANKKPYECKLCNSGYRNMKDCAMHIATKHEMWPKEFAMKNYRQIADKNPAFVKYDMNEILNPNYKKEIQ